MPVCSCGEGSGDDARFCIGCGAPLRSPFVSLTTVPATTDVGASVPTAEVATVPAQGTGADERRPRRSRRWLLLAGCCMAALVLVGVGAYVTLRPGDPVQSSEFRQLEDRETELRAAIEAAEETASETAAANDALRADLEALEDEVAPIAAERDRDVRNAGRLALETREIEQQIADILAGTFVQQ